MGLGMIQVKGTSTYALFDTGAMHSFINTELVEKVGCKVDKMEKSMGILTPTNGMVIAQKFVKRCCLKINEKKTHADLVVIEMQKYDVILGMTWMSIVDAKIDCRSTKLNYLLKLQKPTLLSKLQSLVLSYLIRTFCTCYSL